MNFVVKAFLKKKKKKKGITHILGMHDTGVGNFFIMCKSR